MRDLWLKIGYTSGAQIYSLLISLVSLSLTSRWLGPDGRGVVAAVLTWVALFFAIGCFTLGPAVIHRAIQMQPRPWLGKTMGSLLLLTALITVMAWIFAYTLYWVTGGAAFSHLPPATLALGFLLLPFFLWEQYSSFMLMALDRVGIYNRAQYIGRTAGLLMVLAAWRFDLGIPGVLAGMVLAQVIVALAGIRFLLERAERPIAPDWETIRALMSDGLKLHLNAVGAFCISYAGILLINHYRGAADTGYYQFAIQLLHVLLIVPQAASKILYGQVVQLGADGAWAYQRRLLPALLGGMTALALLAAGLAPWAIPLVAGARFTPAVLLFQLLLCAAIGMSLGMIVRVQWIGRGLLLQSSLVTLALGGLNLLTCLLLIPRHGMYGAAWSAILVYGLGGLINGGMAVRWELAYRKYRRARQVSSSLALPAEAL